MSRTISFSYFFLNVSLTKKLEVNYISKFKTLGCHVGHEIKKQIPWLPVILLRVVFPSQLYDDIAGDAHDSNRHKPTDPTLQVLSFKFDFYVFN